MSGRDLRGDAERGEPDVGRLLGLSGPGGWMLAGLYTLTYTTLAVWAGGEPFAAVEGKVTLALVIASAVALVLPGRFPLGLPTVVALLAVVVFATTATVWRLSPTGWPGWGAWQFGAITFLMFGLAVRGRVAAGAIGLLLMALITIHWTWTTTGDWFHGFDLVYRQLASYAAGAFFAVWLRRTARRVVEFQRTEARRISQETALDAAEEERRAQLERVRRIAGPSLAAIAAGHVTPEERREHGLLEAALRDGIRGRALATGALPAAVRAARDRGVEVALLDDVRDEPTDAAFLAAAIDWAAGRVDDVRTGEATVRLARLDGAPVVTFTATGRPPESFRG